MFMHPHDSVLQSDWSWQIPGTGWQCLNRLTPNVTRLFPPTHQYICISTDSSPLTADIGKLMLWTRLLHESLLWQNVIHQHTCAVVSLASIILVWPYPTVPQLCPFNCCSTIASASATTPWLRPLQLLPDYAPSSWSSPIAFACDYACTVQSIVHK